MLLAALADRYCSALWSLLRGRGIDLSVGVGRAKGRQLLQGLVDARKSREGRRGVDAEAAGVVELWHQSQIGQGDLIAHTVLTSRRLNSLLVGYGRCIGLVSGGKRVVC